MQTLLLFALATYLALPIPTAGQTLTYDVLVAGKKSGTLVVRADRLNSNLLTVASDAKISVAFTDAHSTLQAQFRNGQLQKASVVQKVNEKIRESAEINHDGTQYHVAVKGKEATTLKQAIDYSIALIYHVEPKGKKTVFSERYGAFCVIRNLGASKYELQMPDGKKAFYTYENGICTTMQTRQMLMEVRFELAEN
jgi:hypothetical protein